MLKHKSYIVTILLLMSCCTALCAILIAPQDTVGLRHVFAKLVKLDKKFFHRKFIKHNLKVDSHSIIKKIDTTLILKNNTVVFGWHPYWNEDSYKAYNYNLLSHVAYFSCSADVNTGQLTALNGWDTTSLVNYVHAQNPNCKVILTFACFGQNEISTLLNTLNAQKKLIQALVSTVTKKKADGICLDFEGITSNKQTAFTSFVSELSQACKKEKLSLSLTLPAINTNPSPYNFEALQTMVDLFLIMGYDYFGSFSKTYAGPSAPNQTVKNWISATVGQSVNYYLNNKIPNTKLILAVPYYGAIWETKNQSLPSRLSKFIGYRPYSYALNIMNRFKNDSTIKTSYYIYPIKDSASTYRAFYLDTKYSLSLKYDLINTTKLAGVGIWCLGYDAGTDELWQLLQNKFSTNSTMPPKVRIDSVNKDSIPILKDSIKVPIVKTDTSIWVQIKFLIALSEKKIAAFFFTIATLLICLLLVLIKVIRNPLTISTLKSSGLYYIFYFVIIILSAIIYFGLAVCFYPYAYIFVLASIAVLLLWLIIKRVKRHKQKVMP